MGQKQSTSKNELAKLLIASLSTQIHNAAPICGIDHLVDGA